MTGPLHERPLKQDVIQPNISNVVDWVPDIDQYCVSVDIRLYLATGSSMGWRTGIIMTGHSILITMIGTVTVTPRNTDTIQNTKSIEVKKSPKL